MAKRYQAYVIAEGKDDKKYWREIGVAFENQDGSINVKLDAFPVNGEMQLRVPRPREEEGGEPSSNRNNGGNTRQSNNSNNNRGGRR